MTSELTSHQPAECILFVDGAFRTSCTRESLGEKAKQLAAENVGSLIDVYSHHGTVRLRPTTTPENDGA